MYSFEIPMYHKLKQEIGYLSTSFDQKNVHFHDNKHNCSLKTEIDFIM